MKFNLEFAICILLINLQSCSTKKVNYSPALTSDGILKLDVGMSKKQVIHEVGIPLNDTSIHEWNMTKKVVGEHPMIWIAFDTLSKLQSVQVVYYDYMDDYSIYGLRKKSGQIYRWGCKSSQELDKYLK